MENKTITQFSRNKNRMLSQQTQTTQKWSSACWANVYFNRGDIISLNVIAACMPKSNVVIKRIKSQPVVVFKRFKVRCR